MVATEDRIHRPPRDELVRSVSEFVLERADGKAKMRGHFAVFDEWTEIDSVFEGHFLERVAPGAFSKAFQSPQRERIRVLLNHGHDPELGDKPIGEARTLEEDGVGARYVVDLFDGVPDLVRQGIDAGQYGASFRFRVMREEYEPAPEISDHNPQGLPERTIKEAQVFEFGPTPFPAYEGATAGMRSMTDDYLRSRGLTLGDIPGADKSEPAQPQGTPAQTPPTQPAGTSEQPQEGEDMAVDLTRYDSLELLVSRDDELVKRVQYLNTEHAGQEFPPDVQTEWDEIKEERAAIAAKQAHIRERNAYLEQIASKTQINTGSPRAVPGTDEQRRIGTIQIAPPTPENVWDIDAYRLASRSAADEAKLIRDGAMRALELARFEGYPTDESTIKHNVESLIRRKMDPEAEQWVDGSYVARRVLVTGSPEYGRAFAKYAQQRFLTSEESRVMDRAQAEERAFTLGSTGLPVPYQLDPTVLQTSNWSVNPFRAISRVVQTTVNQWRGATSGGITAAYATEPTEASDNTPTLAQPTINANRAQAFVPFSIEVDQDWGEVQAEMVREVQDAKDDLEATKFTLGSGTNEPKGIITATTGVLVITTTTGAFVVGDTYKLEEALAPRFRPRASIIGNRFVLNKVRQFDTQGGSSAWLPYPALGQGLNSQVPTPGNVGYGVLGYPTYEDSAMDSALTTGSEILVMGDFSYFIIVDRIGMSAELLPHLVSTNHRPTGQRGLFFFWRNGSDVASAAAFKTLQT